MRKGLLPRRNPRLFITLFQRVAAGNSNIADGQSRPTKKKTREGVDLHSITTGAGSIGCLAETTPVQLAGNCSPSKWGPTRQSLPERKEAHRHQSALVALRPKTRETKKKTRLATAPRPNWYTDQTNGCTPPTHKEAIPHRQDQGRGQGADVNGLDIPPPGLVLA